MLIDLSIVWRSYLANHHNKENICICKMQKNCKNNENDFVK